MKSLSKGDAPKTKISVYSRCLTILISASFCCCLGGCSESPEEAKKKEVIQWLKRWPPPPSVEPLSDLDPYDSEEDWINAGRKIEGIEKVLIELCEKNTTELDPYDIICSLAYFATAHSVPGLIRIVEDEDRHSSVRWIAATTLGRIGDPAAVQPLCRMVSSIEDDVHDDTLIINAIAGLSMLGDPNTIPVIEKALRNPHFDPDYKDDALELLEELRQKVD